MSSSLMVEAANAEEAFSAEAPIEKPISIGRKLGVTFLTPSLPKLSYILFTNDNFYLMTLLIKDKMHA